MRTVSGLLILAACMPYMIWADSAAAAAAAAAASKGGAAASAASAAAASGNGAAVATAAAAASSSDIDYADGCGCTREYDPVCGTDRRTYSNDCWRRCVSKEYERRGYKPIRLLHKGVCAPRSCICPAVYDPVCGTNGQTYPNSCELGCENDIQTSNGLGRISIAYPGVCKKPIKCVCPSCIVPVCATNGKTYRNVCVMEYYSRLAQAKGLPSFSVKHKRACKKETCQCTYKKDEVCASDGNTYFSKCAVECQNWRLCQLGLPTIKILYKGKCIKCSCPVNVAPTPVCASNDVTFPNYCQFKCENEKRKASNLPLLFVRWDGPCDCGCCKEWHPVCATDKNTYPNRCHLKCKNKKRVQDGLKPLGILGDGVCYNCDCKKCGYKGKPVCGSDNKTYWNDCWLECISACRCKSDYPRLWKFHDGACY